MWDLFRVNCLGGDPRGNFMAVIVWGQLSVGNCH